MATSKTHAIVGGGLLGLTLALRLREAGHEVTVLEAAPFLGGLASAWQLGDITWDRHYHVTLLSDLRTRALLADLGLDEDMNWVVTKTGCFGENRLVSVSNTLEYIRFPLLGLVDKARLAATILWAARIDDWQALEQMTVEAWLRRWSGKRTYERFWRPLLRSKLGAAHERTSAAFIWATIQRLYAARKSGLKEELFGYVRGGYARILERARQVLTERGAKLELGARIARIEPAGPAGSGLTVHHEDGRSERFDKVVLTTAPAIASALCEGLDGRERELMAQVQYLSIVCASVLLTRPLGGYYVTNLVDEGFPFTGIIEMSALVPPDELGGHHLVYLPRYLAPGDDYADKSDATVRDEFMAGLRRVYPDLADDEIKAFQISRARNVMPIPTVGYSKTVLPFRTSVPGLFVANSSQIINGTLNVNETVSLAERAFKDIVA